VKIFVVSPIHLLTTVNERYGLIEKVNFRFARQNEAAGAADAAA